MIFYDPFVGILHPYINLCSEAFNLKKLRSAFTAEPLSRNRQNLYAWTISQTRWTFSNMTRTQSVDTQPRKLRWCDSKMQQLVRVCLRYARLTEKILQTSADQLRHFWDLDMGTHVFIMFFKFRCVFFCVSASPFAASLLFVFFLACPFFCFFAAVVLHGHHRRLDHHHGCTSPSSGAGICPKSTVHVLP